MSAYIVSPKHIDALLNFANRDSDHTRVTLTDGRVLRFNQVDDLDFAAELLTRQNYASVNHRYEKDTPVPAASFSLLRQVYTPGEILVACDGYDYQACETEGYFESDAAKIVNAVRRCAICSLPEYRAAKTWSID